MIAREFQYKFYTHEENWKKLKALIHYSQSVEKFPDEEALKFLSTWIGQEMLDEEGQYFLDYLLKKHNLEEKWELWCCKNKWVKRQIDPQASKKSYSYFKQAGSPDPEKCTRRILGKLNRRRWVQPQMF